MSKVSTNLEKRCLKRVATNYHDPIHGSVDDGLSQTPTSCNMNSEGVSHIQHQLGSDIGRLHPPPVAHQTCDGEVGEGSGNGSGGGGDGEVEEGIYVTERQRRAELVLKYSTLRSLIPNPKNPTKTDRASIVRDAVNRIKDLTRTVDELKLQVLEKKQRREKMKADHDLVIDMERLSIKVELDHPFGEELKCSSWLRRKSEDSSVEVRIIDDEVKIMLKHKSSCLPSVAAALAELQLDLVNVMGGRYMARDSYIFMLKAKICEGSSVCAEAIAKKLLDVMDGEYQALAFHGTSKI